MDSFEISVFPGNGKLSEDYNMMCVVAVIRYFDFLDPYYIINIYKNKILVSADSRLSDSQVSTNREYCNYSICLQIGNTKFPIVDGPYCAYASI